MIHSHKFNVNYWPLGLTPTRHMFQSLTLKQGGIVCLGGN